LAKGKLENILTANSLTARYLNKQKNIRYSSAKYLDKNGIKIECAFANNLKNITLNIPVNGLIVVSGVSGSGKTSLVFDVLHESAKAKKPINCQVISGLGQFNNIIAFDSSAIGQSSISNVLTYTGLFTAIRDIFANTSAAKKQNLGKKHFSFNQKGGRCETCQGQGRIKISMDFLSDVYVECEDCKGKRFSHEVLACKYDGKTIFDILEMTIEEGLEFFNASQKLHKSLSTLCETGLSYIKMGQSLNTFSGGEVQRLKLANILISSKAGRNLFLMDEPTTGLHFHDVNQLLKIIERLISEGHSVIMVEHHPDIIRNADWLIELGPEGGDGGGRVLRG
ncbi:MAG: ATP-binding cassette domain-containing protein, partial [Bacteroidota bacterium]|nr:ATP-binding cassette domain-containing protein [Bacteroidota bacterium]